MEDATKNIDSKWNKLIGGPRNKEDPSVTIICPQSPYFRAAALFKIECTFLKIYNWIGDCLPSNLMESVGDAEDGIRPSKRITHWMRVSLRYRSIFRRNTISHDGNQSNNKFKKNKTMP